MSNKEIFTTKPFIPPFDEYADLVRRAFDNEEFTNHASLLTELETKLEYYLKLDGLQCVTSATTGLQMAVKALEIEPGSEIITTPFSYVATTTAILAEKCEPVYVDIEPDNFNLDADKIERAITPKTKAIMPVHIFGYACNIEKIADIARKYNLKVIYDAAHAFAAEYKGKSILEYGDISVVSLQESKLFHTVEGGIVYSADKSLMERINLLKQCGHIDDNFITDGFNARLSELHAAMGLANIKYIDKIIEKRKKLCEIYDNRLAGMVKLPKKQPDLTYKYPYYVIVLKSVEEKDKVLSTLCEKGIYPWHCYYPTLNTLQYLKNHQQCPVAEDICARILQMPLYYQLETDDAERVCDETIKAIRD
ncbi:MAG: DegT/DnrJ/EryC1/StrS family aminotransferase [Candidatus Gastranaerophilales bacterium]|nr:DegT/DnrJ/EryC1/StrS family aminotransferase [Candidatus Gastranaerophilales bacterium]